MKFKIYDTTEESGRAGLEKLLDRHGKDIIVESVHTAGAITDEARYHWVTIIYSGKETT